MKGHKGKVFFLKDVKHDYFICVMANKAGESGLSGNDYVEVGSCEVDVEFEADTRQKEVELLEAQIKEKGAEHQLWLNTMSGKIQSLLAIDHTEITES